MKFRIHWAIGGCEDSVDIVGENIEEIRAKAIAATDIRGLDVDKNNLWSEELEC
jgi:hypothetical protein